MDNTFTAGHNQFSTWTDDEYKKMLGDKDSFKKEEQNYTRITELTDVPASIDWRARGMVNPIKN